MKLVLIIEPLSGVEDIKIPFELPADHPYVENAHNDAAEFDHPYDIEAAFMDSILKSMMGNAKVDCEA